MMNQFVIMQYKYIQKPAEKLLWVITNIGARVLYYRRRVQLSLDDI